MGLKSAGIKGVLVLVVAIGAGVMAGGAGNAAAVQMGGPVFVSGDDAEDHCAGTDCGGLYAAALKSTVELSRSPGDGILAISMTDQDSVDALNSWNSPANGGPGVDITTVAGNGINSVDFAAFDVIFVPSNESDPENPQPGITNANLARLNNRQADIVHFVNNLGGGLVALTEQDADPSIAFGFLPIHLEFMNIDYIDAEPTTALAALAPNADGTNMDHDNWHNVWTGPTGFAGLEVLAVTPEVLDDHGQPSAAILGGAQVVLRGQLELTPSSATNPVGTDHTVTVTILDPIDSSPVSGVDVNFEVTEGPNAGASGQGTTDANGQATFTYTGTGGEGSDVIQACFRDEQENQHCDVATKDWIAQVAEIQLTPDGARLPIRGQHMLTAAVMLDSAPVKGVDVSFEVVSGPNMGASGQGTTDSQGEATFAYTGGDELGDDTIRACFMDKQKNPHCDEVMATWALQKGDNACDKDVDSVDSLITLRNLVGFTYSQTEPCPDIGTDFGWVFADMDCDGDADAADGLHVLRFVAGLPSTLPQGCALVGSALPPMVTRAR